METNVVSLNKRLETWKNVYAKEDMLVQVSSFGRFKFLKGEQVTNLDFFDSVDFLKKLSVELEQIMCTMYNGNK